MKVRHSHLCLHLLFSYRIRDFIHINQAHKLLSSIWEGLVCDQISKELGNEC